MISHTGFGGSHYPLLDCNGNCGYVSDIYVGDIRSSRVRRATPEEVEKYSGLFRKVQEATE